MEQELTRLRADMLKFARLQLRDEACDGCTHFRQQVAFMRLALRRLPEREDDPRS